MDEVHVIYNDTNIIRLTKRLIMLMKKEMRLLGDEPMRLAIDGYVAPQEDYGTSFTWR